MPKVSSYGGMTPILTDLLYGVDDPGGTPISNSLTITALRDLLTTNLTEIVAVGSLVAATGNEIAFDFSYTTNKATSGNDTGIFLNWTDTASPGTSLLIDLQKGGTSVFFIRGDNAIGTAATVMSWRLNNNTIANFRNDAAGKGMTFRDEGVLSWAAFPDPAGTTPDVRLYRDSAGTLALRDSDKVQAINVYGTWGSSTDYHRGAFATAKVTLSSVSGATVTATNLIPAGAIVIGVTTKVTTGLGTGNGTTGYSVGDTDADRWGSITGTASGTSSDNRDWVVNTVQAFLSATDVVLTALGGNFDGTGVIDVSVQYLIGQVD